jgi:hypothetical protein
MSVGVVHDFSVFAAGCDTGMLKSAEQMGVDNIFCILFSAAGTDLLLSVDLFDKVMVDFGVFAAGGDIGKFTSAEKWDLVVNVFGVLSAVATTDFPASVELLDDVIDVLVVFAAV